MKKDDKSKKSKNIGRRGGYRENAGRKKGKVSEVRKALREMAQDYAPRALQILIDVAEHGDTSSSRVSAARELLDRGYGKPVQVNEGGEHIDPVQLIVVRAAPMMTEERAENGEAEQINLIAGGAPE